MIVRTARDGLRQRWEARILWGTTVLLAAFAFAGSAQAAPGCSPEGDCPPFLGSIGSFGFGAGQLNNPRVTADPDTGHIFVLEPANRRVSEFDAEENWKFVKAWGWGVRDGSAELQTCTAETGCMRGLAGTGAGQIQFAFGITLDEEGNVWTAEFFSGRVQKFSPAGEFLLMVGGEVNETKVKKRKEQEANAEPVTITEAEENLCTAVSGDDCGAGTEGVGAGQFNFPASIDAGESGSGGIIYVGDENRILEFAEDGTYEGDIPLPGAGSTEALAVAPDGSLYVVSQKVTEKVDNGKELVNSFVVREIGPAGEEIRRLKSQWQGRTVPQAPQALAVDVEENVYVAGTVIYELPPPKESDPPIFKPVEEVLAFETDGELISFEPDKAGFGAPTDSSDLVGLATNVIGDGSGEPGEVLAAHFDNGVISGTPLAYIRAYGWAFKPNPEPPAIEDQYATAVTAIGARIEALINPRFTSDTTYQVEYDDGPCDPGSCESVAPVEPAQLSGGAVNAPQETGPVELTGLQPGTTYHFRFRAENEVTEGEESGPVFGGEGTFRTFGQPEPPEPCANDTFRLGSATMLPDCRAYEMVSPVDKAGGEVSVLASVPGYPAEVNQGAPSGEDLTYSSYRGFTNLKSAPYTSQYIAHRTGSSWSSDSISPQREGVLFPALDSQYKLFSKDLERAWLVTDSEPVLAEGGLPDYRNLYRRDNETDAYEAQCSTQPQETPAEGFLLEPQGRSADGSHLVFWANGRLLDEAAPGKVPQVYECFNDTELRLVSLLPGGEASPVGGSTGIGNNGLSSGFGFRQNNVAGAVSADGSRIFWTAAASGPGPLYVRIDGTITVEIAPANARFRMASPGGDRVIYTVGKDLFEAGIDNETSISAQIAGEVEGVMGTSEDARFVYLVSREDLDGGGAAEAGKPNLYLYRAEEDSFTFIGILSEDDAREVFLSEESEPVLTPVARFPYNRSSRVSADGLHAAFTSTASLTGYDNTDQASGEQDTEVFVYDAISEELACVSCNPTNAWPRGKNIGTQFNPFWTAAFIPGWENQLHGARALSEDGNRLFFNAIDPLALGDTNGEQDVYQWEAVGSGTCKEFSPTYSPTNGGCIDLISSGKSPQSSELVDASSDGDDVFFKTAQSLWPADPGLVDIYDARVEGGFPPPPPDTPVCTSNCQERGPEPTRPNPATTTFVGPGNVVEGNKKPKKCRKGTHKVRKAGKVRCVKNKAKKGRRAAR